MKELYDDTPASQALLDFEKENVNYAGANTIEKILERAGEQNMTTEQFMQLANSPESMLSQWIGEGAPRVADQVLNTANMVSSLNDNLSFEEVMGGNLGNANLREALINQDLKTDMLTPVEVHPATLTLDSSVVWSSLVVGDNGVVGNVKGIDLNPPGDVLVEPGMINKPIITETEMAEVERRNDLVASGMSMDEANQAIWPETSSDLQAVLDGDLILEAAPAELSQESNTPQYATLTEFLESDGIQSLYFDDANGNKNMAMDGVKVNDGDYALSSSDQKSAASLAQEIMDLAEERGVDISQFEDVKQVRGYDDNPRELSAEELGAYMVGMSMAGNTQNGMFGLSSEMSAEFQAVSSELAVALGQQAFGDTSPDQSSIDTSTEQSMQNVSNNSPSMRC